MDAVLSAAKSGAILDDDHGVIVVATYGDEAAERRALEAAAAKCDRSPAGVIEVRGGDALTFLQSLLSQDLLARPAPAAFPALLLQPTGKLDAVLRVRVAAPDLVWLDTDLGRTSAVISALNRFRIRVDAELRDATTEIGRIEVRGPEADAEVLAVFGVAPGPEAGAVQLRDDLWLVRSDWGSGPGIECIGPRAAMDDVWSALAIPAAGARARDYLRILYGSVRDGIDVDEDTIPQEAFLERDAVSFTKGCFLGQELVCRIDSRGHVNRFVRRITVRGAVPEPGALLRVDDREVGVVTSVAPTPDGAVVLGMVRREIAPGDTVHLEWDAQVVRGTLEGTPE